MGSISSLYHTLGSKQIAENTHVSLSESKAGKLTVGDKTYSVKVANQTEAKGNTRTRLMFLDILKGDIPQLQDDEIAVIRKELGLDMEASKQELKPLEMRRIIDITRAQKTNADKAIDFILNKGTEAEVKMGTYARNAIADFIKNNPQDANVVKFLDAAGRGKRMVTAFKAIAESAAKAMEKNAAELDGEDQKTLAYLKGFSGLAQKEKAAKEEAKAKIEEGKIEEGKEKAKAKEEEPKVNTEESKENIEELKDKAKEEEPKENIEELKDKDPKIEDPKDKEPKVNTEELKDKEPKVNTEDPKDKEPKVNTEEPKDKEPKVNTEEPKKEESKIEDPKIEVPKVNTEEAKVKEEAKIEEPKVNIEEPKDKESKVNTEEPKDKVNTEEPKTEKKEDMFKVGDWVIINDKKEIKIPNIKIQMQQIEKGKICGKVDAAFMDTLTFLADYSMQKTRAQKTFSNGLTPEQMKTRIEDLQHRLNDEIHSFYVLAESKRISVELVEERSQMLLESFKQAIRECQKDAEGNIDEEALIQKPHVDWGAKKPTISQEASTHSQKGAKSKVVSEQIDLFDDLDLEEDADEESEKIQDKATLGTQKTQEKTVDEIESKQNAQEKNLEEIKKGIDEHKQNLEKTQKILKEFQDKQENTENKETSEI